MFWRRNVPTTLANHSDRSNRAYRIRHWTHPCLTLECRSVAVSPRQYTTTLLFCMPKPRWNLLFGVTYHSVVAASSAHAAIIALSLTDTKRISHLIRIFVRQGTWWCW